MAPPAKRRRRNVVQESDDEDDRVKPAVNTLTNYLFSSPDAKDSHAPANSPSPSPVRKSSRPTTTQLSKPAAKPLRSHTLNGTNTKNGVKSASGSPEKARTKPPAKGKVLEKGKTADLMTLFSKQAERAATKPATQIDDITSDPISDEDDVGVHRAATASHVGLAARKRFSTQSGPSSATTISATSQKFLRPSGTTNLADHTPIDDDDQRPWSERFGPKNLSELAVHKKKVSDVRMWLDNVLMGRVRQRLLILKGAAGTGKTTTLKLLAKDMGCELLEWRNPTGSYRGLGFQSTSAQFEEFLGKGGKFSQLDIGPEDSDSSGSKKEDTKRKIILIEEFPNTFARSSTAMTSFRNVVLSFLATNTPSLNLFSRGPSSEPTTPVVMVISETLLTTTSASADSFTAHRLLGPEINRHPGTCIIEFNAIAPTLLSAALELIVQKEAKKSGRRRMPGPLVLKRLGEIGDIRSAISSLQFLCLKGDADADWGAQVAYGKPKRSIKTSVALTQGEVETLQLVSQREASLGIFHAVGKVVYNKRVEIPLDPDTPEGRAEILPDYLTHCCRPRKSEISVDSLIDETGTDTHTFISALHENYLLSCEPSNSLDTNSFLDYMSGCIDYLSESDLLCPSWDVFFGGRSGGSWGSSSRDSASHVLRQEEITFQVATRGLLYSLPSPVKRAATGPRRGGGDQFKMFYPTSLKLWREKEELEGLVDHWSTTLLKGDDSGQNVTEGASAFRRLKSTKTNTTGQWLGSQTQASQRSFPSSKSTEQSQTNNDNNSTPLLSLGSAARRELLLERLPYMANILRQRRVPGTTARLKEIEKMVSFSGIGGTGDEEAADMDENQGDDMKEAWATDRPTEERSPKKTKPSWRQNKEAAASAVPVPVTAVQKLVLSDDDIEDD
ncbi:Rad17 cell cycle checkpoint protein-domain-containing protein [Xylariaceae sp. FL1272]|nr:Rad17 cell cycle checkpoint protein-domain-containing protein [Xylariaceae sp. FL1272]